MPSESGDGNSTRSEPQIQWLIDVAVLLQQDILADDADVGGSVLHISGHVGRPDDQERHPDFRAGKQQAPAIGRGLDRAIPGFRKQFERRLDQLAFAECNGQHRLSFSSLDDGAESAKLLFDSLVAAVQMIDAQHLGGAFGGQTGQHQTSAGAQI